MPVASTDLDQLQRRRDTIRQELASIGELRPGSLRPRFRKCGKPSCHCARENDPGHGPSWFLSRIVKGKMHCRGIPPHALEDTRRQVAECQRLRELTQELIEVSDTICQLRLRSGASAPRAKKRGSRPRSRRNSPPRSSV